MAALLLASIGFFIASPYALIKPVSAARGFAFELRHAAQGHSPSKQEVPFVISPWSQLWMYHLGRSVIPGMTFLASICALIGLGILFKRRSLEGAIVLLLFLLFLLPSEFANSKPPPQPERYILGAIPFLCIASAELVRWLWASGWKICGFLITVILIGSPLVRSLHLARDLGNDTRTQFVAWALENLPRRTQVFVDFSTTYSGSLSRGRFRRKYGSVFRWKAEKRLDYVVESSFGSGRFLEQPNSHYEIQSDLLKLRAKSELVKEFRSRSGPYGRGGPGKLDHLLRWLRPESERMRSHGKTKEFLSSV